MAANFQLEGFTDLRDQLLRLGAVAGLKVLAKASRKAMVPVRDTAKSLVPVSNTHEAHLRDAISIRTTKPKNADVVVSSGLVLKKQKIAGEIEIADDYSLDFNVKVDVGWRWHFTELGTSHSAAHPFLRPAFAQNVSRMIDVLKDETNQNIQKAIKNQLGADA